MLEQATPLPGQLSPLVSVVVPIYNMKAWLVPCLESLATQTLEQIEILLIDDGSTDSSADICAKFVTKDARFKYIYQENAGLGPARNTGVQHSTADYLTFVDSDDIVSIDYCEKLFSGLTSSAIEIVSCKFCRMDENGTLGEEQQNFLADVDIEIDGVALSDGEKILGLYSSSISCARLYKTSFLKTNDLKFPKRLPHEDWFFTYKAFLLAKAVQSVPEALYFWRIRGDSLSQTTRQSHVDSMFTLLQDSDDFLETISASPQVRSLANKRNLMLFVQLWNRSARAGKDIVEHYKERLPEHLKDISKRYAALDHHFLNKEYREQAARIIQIGSSLNVINSFADHKTFNIVRQKLPKAHDDKAHRLLELKNAFKGERCFIIGNGPSLNLNNLDLLQGEFTFAVNSFFLKTRDTGFMPTFYVVEDNKVMEENAKDIREFDAPFKFFPEEYRRYDLEADTTCFFSLDQEFYMKSKPYYGIPRFSVSAHKEIFAGQTVTYANMQLAFYMGFTEVYLIGMDFNYHIPPEHKRTGNHILSTTDDPNHFHKDYFGKGKTWKDPQLDRVLLNYKMADLIYTAAQRKIYNATVGGKLEVFERVDYASLFTAKDSLSGTEKVQTEPQSISKAHELFNAGAFAECAQMCDQLYQSRKLEMYRQFAQYARQHLETS